MEEHKDIKRNENGAYKKGKRWRNEERLWKMEQRIMPLGMVDGSKMSGVEPPLEVHYTQDKTQELQEIKLTNHSTMFLFYSISKCLLQ